MDKQGVLFSNHVILSVFNQAGQDLPLVEVAPSDTVTSANRRGNTSETPSQIFQSRNVPHQQRY